MKTRALNIGVLAVFFVMAVCCGAAHAGAVITNRTGAVRITKPDGAVLSIGKRESLPEIPSGSIIDVLGGSLDIAPEKGFIQIAAGNLTAAVEAGSRVTVVVDAETGRAEFRAEAGEIRVTAGNTAVRVGAGQQARVKLDPITGAAEVRSIKGLIETGTIGVRVTVPEGAAARISVDADTRMVHIESADGTVEAVLTDGKVVQVAEGEKIDVSGYVVGEIQTFPGLTPVIPLQEEPAEPERYEGSRFMP